MTKHNYKQNAYYLIYLIRCVLHNRIPAKEKLIKMDLSGVFAVAKMHSLAAIAAYALESAGIYNDAFAEAKNKVIRKSIILDAERENVFSKFDAAGIWYVPLKGIVIKDYYPEIGMRQMADNDFLIDKTRQEDIKRIMLECGFYVNQYDKSKHDVYFKEPLCNFQMHVSLFETNPDDPLYCYFKDIDKRLLSVKDSCQRQFSDEDFYLYIKAHEYKHFASGGTGLRSIVDTYMILSHFFDKLDMNYIQQECEKLGIAEFEEQSRKLAIHMFGGKKLTEEESKMTDYIIFSGTYGTFENVINNKLNKPGDIYFAKLKYIKSRLFVPIRKSDPNYKAYSTRYKWFYANRVRLPLLFFYRLGLALTSRQSRAKAEIKALRKI